jgi:arylsulfatase A-like enzyme
MIFELDLQVGLIINALKESGAYKNTLFIFTSDNGGLSFDKDMKKAGHDTSHGLSGSKGSINEGGHRVPFIAVWPGVIKKNSVSNEPISGQDVVATIAALGNQKLDQTKVFDSANLLPYFKGKAKSKAHMYLMHQSASGPTFAIRDGDWKLIMKSDIKKKSAKVGNLKPTHLYNLKENLEEDSSGNLISEKQYVSKVSKLKAKYIEIRKSNLPTVKY